MWHGKKVSVVLMTYAEKGSIREVIEGFEATGIVDEILVVNNNAEEGTSEEVAPTSAREVFETAQGYGNASRRGLREATGDLIVLAEPDGTFLPDDIHKLLVFSGECDAVFGTRTTRELIWQGANMEWFLRWGNWAVAKMVEVLFNTSHLSDVGCTYRALHPRARDARRRPDGDRRQSRRPGDDADLDHVGRALRRDPGQLPAARRHVIGDRQPARRDLDRPADDRDDPALPPPHSPQAASARAPRAAAGGRIRPVTEANFDEIATEYDESLPAHVVQHYLDKRVQFVADRTLPGRGLDVGCGTGVLAARLAAIGWRMEGIDPSQGMLDVMAREAPEVEGKRAFGDDLPFEDSSFDLVITVAALHHVADPAAVRGTLIEMARVVRPGGRIVVWDHNPRNPYWKLLMARVPQDDGTERLIPEDEVLAGLRAGGAEIISSDQLGFVPDFVPPRLLPAMAKVEDRVERTPVLRRLCAHNVVTATK